MELVLVLILILIPALPVIALVLFFTARRRRREMTAQLEAAERTAGDLRQEVHQLNRQLQRVEQDVRELQAAWKGMGQAAAATAALPPSFVTVPDSAAALADERTSLVPAIVTAERPETVHTPPVIPAEPVPALTPESEPVLALEPLMAALTEVSPVDAVPTVDIGMESVATSASAAAAVTVPASERVGRLQGVTPPGEETDWEAMVGGNWLNKVGVLVFVIGLSLFLGYSLSRFNPAGRVAIGWAMSLGLLGGGVALERRPEYRLFSRGLLAGGWAGSYFVAFAMYALPAARVIASPVASTAMLLLVAAGMVAHSVRYRSETLTALMYLIAFATLNIAPLAGFTLLASVPLAISLLTVSYRFQWTGMATVGVLFTYASFLLRLLMSDGTGSTWDLAVAQTILAMYWVTFEAFDLLQVRRQHAIAARSVFPLNAVGFIGLSVLLWNDRGPSIWVLYAATGLAYVASAVLRARIKRAQVWPDITESLDGDENAAWDLELLARLLSGGYEGSITAGAALLAGAFVQQFSGLQMPLALLVEGELLVMSGLQLRTRFVRGLGSLVLVGAAMALFPVLGSSDQHTFALLGGLWADWLPVVVLFAAALYMNGALVSAAARVAAEPVYRAGATLLMTIAIGHQASDRFIGLAWLTYSALLLEASIRSGVLELRRHAYAVGFMAMMAFSFAAPDQPLGQSWHRVFLIGSALAYFQAARFARVCQGIGADEQRVSRQLASWAATLLAAGSAWYGVPHAYMGLAFVALAWPLAEVGLKYWSECRYQAFLLGGVGAAQIVVRTGLALQPMNIAHPLILLGVAGAMTAAAAARFFAFGESTRPEQLAFRDAAAPAAITFGALLAWHALPVPVVALAWGALALVLVELGRASRWRLLVIGGHTVATLAFGRLFLANFAAVETVGGVSVQLLTVGPMIALFYLLGFRMQLDDGRTAVTRSSIERAFLWMAACAGAALMRFELGRAFAASGFSVFALALIAYGVKRSDRDLRLQGYVLAVLAFVRGWTTNFDSPGAFGGASTSIAMAAIVAISLYVAEFMIPRSWTADTTSGESETPVRLPVAVPPWLDAHARAALSVAATILTSMILFEHVPAGLRTVAWGLQGFILLTAGFPLRESTLRRSGLLLLGICIVKVLAYDSLQLETIARIVSFMLLGAVLIVASWIYTRFGTMVKRYL